MKKQKSIQDTAITLFLITLCIFVFVTAGGFKGESGMFPRIVAAVTLLLCLMQLAANLHAFALVAKAPAEKSVRPATGFIKASVSLIAYVVLIFILGYYVATILYLLFAIYLFGFQKKLPLALIVAGMITGIYLLFTLLLRVGLPTGLII